MIMPIDLYSTQAWGHSIAWAAKYMADGAILVLSSWGNFCESGRESLLHPRVRRGTALALQHRWWGILSISLQKAVARAILRGEGADLYDSLLEPTPGIADLPVVA